MDLEGVKSSSDPSEATKTKAEMALATFKKPPDPSTLPQKKRRAKVLDEDEYVAQMERIVERDFFPELEKLKARSDFIDATDRNDTAEMRRLRERFSSGIVHERLASPATFETPVIHPQKEKEDTLLNVETSSIASKEDGGEEKKESLDEFLQKHTSEDNESFYELMEASKADFRRTHSWMFKAEEQLSIEHQQERLKLPSIEQQALRDETTSRSKVTKPLDGWTYKNANAVFYPPDGAELSNKERVELAKKEKEVVLPNTRFKVNPWKNEGQQNVLTVAKKEAAVGKVGIDGKDIIEPGSTPAIHGYKLLRIDDPTPMLPVDASPLMTWGQVDSTPYRLEGCETPMPVNTGGGPSFTIQDVPKRDRLAHELAEKNSKFYRDKKGKAIEKARSNIKTPKSKRVSTMSPAAQRLATSKLGIRLGTDKALRASYTPSPRRRTTPSTTRSIISSSVTKRTPSTSVPKTPGTPSLPSESLTDDLLNLPSASKRARATDFFD